MAIVLPAAFNQLAGINVTSQFERLRQAAMNTRSWPSSATNGLTRLDGQGGVWAQPNALNITASGTPDMNVHVDRGLGALPGTEAVTQGNYPFANDGSLTVAITASNTQQRIDSVVVHQKDTSYSGVTNTTEIVPIAGTPGSGLPPNLSSLDKNYLEIGRVTVRANTTSILSTDITNMQHLLPVGLDIPISSELSNPGSFHGQPRVNTFTGEFEWYDLNSGTWHGQQWVSFTPTWSGLGSLGTGFTAVGRYFKTGTRVLVQAVLVAGTGTSLNSNPISFSLPTVASNFNANLLWLGLGYLRPSGLSGSVNKLECNIVPNTSSCSVIAFNGSGLSENPGAAGYSWVAGSIMDCQIEYESAT
jgi:hypothetical protein